MLVVINIDVNLIFSEIGSEIFQSNTILVANFPPYTVGVYRGIQ